eukprot:1784786-Pleurochrysis_carterae.AAC.1
MGSAGRLQGAQLAAENAERTAAATPVVTAHGARRELLRMARVRTSSYSLPLLTRLHILLLPTQPHRDGCTPALNWMRACMRVLMCIHAARYAVVCAQS